MLVLGPGAPPVLVLVTLGGAQAGLVQGSTHCGSAALSPVCPGRQTSPTPHTTSAFTHSHSRVATTTRLGLMSHSTGDEVL